GQARCARHGPQAVGAHRAAGHEDGLHAVREQEARVVKSDALQLLHAAPTVGDARRVAEIDDVLRRQQPPQLAHGGQPAEAGVKYADWSKIHRTSRMRRAQKRIRRAANGAPLIIADYLLRTLSM